MDNEFHLQLLERLRTMEEAMREQTEAWKAGFTTIAQGLADITNQLKGYTGPAVSEFILIGGNMKKGMTLGKKQAGPTPITDDQSGQLIAVVGIDAAGALGAMLAQGDTIDFTPVQDGSVASVAKDDAPAVVSFTDASGVARSNIQSMLSGRLKSAIPVNPNVATTVGYQITKADGTPGNSGTASFQVVPGTEASEALVFVAS